MKYKETAELYKALFESTGTATLVIEDTVIISMNSAAEELTGFKREEVENKKTWMEFIPYKEDLERMIKYRELRLKDPNLAPRRYETRIRDKEGNIKDVMLTVNTIPGTKRFIASLLDTTELKRTNRLLKMLSLANQELVRVDDEKEVIDRILSIVKEYGGYKEVYIDQTIEGSSILRVVTNRELTDIEKDILRELSQDIDYAIRSIRSRKLLRYNEERYRTIFENTPVSLMEEELTEAIEYLESIKASGIDDLESYFKSHPEKMGECIDRVRVLEINRETLDLFKLRDKEDLNTLLKMIPPSEREKSFNEILAYFNGAKEGEFKSINYTLDGEKRYIRLKWFAYPHLPEETERQHKIIVVLIDLTAEELLSDMLREKIKELRKTFDQTIEVISNIVEIRDPYIAGHQKNVSKIACDIARGMGLPEDIVERIRIAGLLHDIGKISIPAEILNKPGRLSPLEFELVKLHPKAGYEILKSVDFLSDIAEISLQHHERLDGSGYPRGLRDGEILLEAKIIAVADVVEAMSSHRPYRPLLPKEVIIKDLLDNKGKLYDPDVVDACLKSYLLS